MKWLLLLGLLYGDTIGGQELSEVEENRVVMEECLAQFERQERAVYWVAMASGMALLVLRWRLGTVLARRFVLRDANRRLVAGYNGGELEVRDASGESAVVLGRGCAWTSTTRRARRGLPLHLDDKGRPQFELEK